MAVMNPRNKILIVDDSKSLARFMRESLAGLYDVREAHSGNEALTVLESFIPDLILLDIIMPGMDGFTLCKKIREDRRFSGLKIIMASGEKTLEDRLAGYEAGADDFLVKPVEIEELRAKVKVFLKIKNLEDNLNRLNNDLNEQVRIRSNQLLEAEKMAAIGKHAAGIVHNLNNPLQSFMGYTFLLSEKYPEDEMVKSLIKSAEIMKDMVVTILDNTVNENNRSAVEIDFNKLLTDQVDLFKADPFFKHQVSKKLIFTPLPSYSGVYSHFSQSLGNLIKNAVEAMHDSEDRRLEISTSYDSEMIYITVSDTGHGIDREDIKKIFDPFYTTKPLVSSTGKPAGTGLGLASSKEMIESYGGSIIVESEKGKGTLLKVSLPYTKSIYSTRIL